MLHVPYSITKWGREKIHTEAFRLITLCGFLDVLCLEITFYVTSVNMLFKFFTSLDFVLYLFCADFSILHRNNQFQS